MKASSCVPIWLLLGAVNVHANVSEWQVPSSDCIAPITFTIQTGDIFELNNEQSIWLHDFANAAHIITKPETIANELAFTEGKCEFDDQELYEIERHLRHLKYIKNVSVTREENGRIKVATSDKWTLMPTFDFARKGGVNKIAAGIKDRNLFGLGIETELEYFSDEQQSGYRLKSDFPLFTGNNIHAGFNLTSTDQGREVGMHFKRPFVSLDTLSAFGFTSHTSNLSTRFFLNGRQWLESELSQSTADAFYGMRLNRQDNNVSRLHLGVASERTEWQVPNFSEQTGPVELRPRIYQTPYIAYSFIESQFERRLNVHEINQIEDVNLGLELVAKLGVNVEHRQYDESLLVGEGMLKWGQSLTVDQLWLNQVSWSFNWLETERPRSQIDWDSEWFWGGSVDHIWYVKQSMTIADDPYFDQPISIGSETGVRGYPIDFQRGAQRLSYSFEYRFYPNISIYQLAELGGAIYLDTGRTFASQDFDNENDGWLTSIGIGARVYSPHTSDAKVIHIDLIAPLARHEKVNEFELRLMVKQHF